jgi:hypothetical protein
MDCGERDSALPLLVVLMVPMPTMQIVQLEEDELLHQLQFNAGRRKAIVGPSAPKQAEVPGKNQRRRPKWRRRFHSKHSLESRATETGHVGGLNDT